MGRRNPRSYPTHTRPARAMAAILLRVVASTKTDLKLGHMDT